MPEVVDVGKRERKKGEEKEYSKKWKYGSYPVALANATAPAPREGFPRRVSNTFAGSSTMAGGR